jgi:signal transduction histidine kinase
MKAYERGAVDYISVPVIPELLRAKVSVFAELHRRARQLEVLNSELRRLSTSLISTQDDERRRIARELHDGLGQDLIAAKIVLDVAQSQDHVPQKRAQAVGEASALIDRSIQQVRSISYLLHPPMLDEVGLHSALRWYLDGITKRSGIEMHLDVQPGEFPRLAPELETTVFRIVQEALTNVFRHSGAHKGWVTLAKSEKDVTVRVRDDGRGVSTQTVEFRPGSIGIGINGMRQRVKEFGGVLKLQNANPGTLLEVVIPDRSPSSIA